MQQVSQEWKDNQKENIVSESYVEINLTVADPDAPADATASDNGHENYSNVTQLADETEKKPIKYATLEKNMWALDGTLKVLPDDPPYGNNGYVGNLASLADGTYTIIPTITIRFSKVFEDLIPGLTISWGEAYDEWADTFRVTVYNGNNKILEKTVSNNQNLVSLVYADISGYDRITIEVLKWSLPYRLARIKSVIIGIEKIFTKADLIKMSHEMSIDPLSASLPKSQISFEIVNLNGEYNPDNPQGAEKYLLERQLIKVRYGYKLNDEIEWINAGTFFMSEWYTPQNGITATFTARDILEYMGYTYKGSLSGTLVDIATEALEQAKLPKLSNGSNRWILDSSLSTIVAPETAKESLDSDQPSIMVILQYVANAGCCVLYQDRSGIIRIEPLPEGETDYEINRFNSYSNSEISLTKQLKAIDVNNGQYVLSVSQEGETQPINNPLISDTQAPVVAQWAAQYLENRRTLTGEFRSDPRLDPLDRVTVENQFSESVVLVTEINYTYNGAFTGNYGGRNGA